MGLILMASPSLVARLLLGAELGAPGEAIGRVAGFGLLALGLGCGPVPASPYRRALVGLLTYNALAAIFFLYLGIRSELVGWLLWPAATIHAVLSVLLARLFVVSKTT